MAKKKPAYTSRTKNIVSPTGSRKRATSRQLEKHWKKAQNIPEGADRVPLPPGSKRKKKK